MSNQMSYICPVCGDALYELYEDGGGDFGEGITVSYKCEGCHQHFETDELLELQDDLDDGEFE